MKKQLLITCVIIAFFGLKTKGQSNSSDDFIMLNYQQNMVSKEFSINNPFYNRKGQQVSLQYVRSIAQNKALRFSFSGQEYHFNRQSSQFTQGDTTYQNYNNYYTFMPKLGIGLEWRKILHKDIMIIGGADFNLGAGRLDNSVITQQIVNGNTSGYGTTVFGDGVALYKSLTPFTGIRINWGRLALGYTAMLPMQLNTAFVSNSRISEFDMRLQHRISVGYRIFNRKKTK